MTMVEQRYGTDVRIEDLPPFHKVTRECAVEECHEPTYARQVLRSPNRQPAVIDLCSGHYPLQDLLEEESRAGIRR